MSAATRLVRLHRLAERLAGIEMRHMRMSVAALLRDDVERARRYAARADSADQRWFAVTDEIQRCVSIERGA